MHLKKSKPEESQFCLYQRVISIGPIERWDWVFDAGKETVHAVQLALSLLLELLSIEGRKSSGALREQRPTFFPLDVFLVIIPFFAVLSMTKAIPDGYIWYCQHEASSALT
jgi:hypothetical protein